jgi:serine/threonine protein kinase
MVEKYTIKLIDFDYIKQIEDSSQMMKSFYGSPLNLAPEIWEIQYGNNCKGYKESADIWSLGIVIYNLVYNKFPFTGNNFKKIYNNILNGKYLIYDQENISLELIDLINGILKVDPEKRYNWEQIINHPFYNLDYNKQSKFDFKGKKIIELNANDYQKKFIDKIEITKKSNVIIEDDDDDLKEKYINDEIFNNIIEIDYTTKCTDVDDDWVEIELNENLK